MLIHVQPTTLKKSAAVLLILIFTALISAPTIILSIDNSIDTSILLGLSEEEEEIEDAKLLFDIEYSNNLSFEKDYPLSDAVYYAYKEDPTPHLNLIFPPPERILF